MAATETQNSAGHHLLQRAGGIWVWAGLEGSFWARPSEAALGEYLGCKETENYIVQRVIAARVRGGDVQEHA